MFHPFHAGFLLSGLILTTTFSPLAPLGCQEPPQALSGEQVLSVAAVRADEDGDAVPDLLGMEVSIRGVVTYPPYRVGDASENRMYVQDETGGIRLLLGRIDSLPVLVEGDRVRVRGVMGQYRAMDQIKVLDLRKLSPGPPLDPEDAPAGDISSRVYLGRLVRVSGHFAIIADQVGFGDRTGVIRVYLRGSVFDPEETARAFSTEKETILVGIVEQYDSEPPLTAGFRLMPRGRNDIQFPPPDRSWILWLFSVIAALSLAGFSSYRWRVGERAASARDREYAQELEAKVSELSESFQHIKRLEGLLPICCNCKKVRLEGEDPLRQESWIGIESYISDRTDADFSHGICPDCTRKLYPGIGEG